MENNEFRIKAYEKLFDSKHHYDNLSWLISSAVVIFAGGLTAYIPNIKADDDVVQFVKRFVVVVLIWAAIWVWYTIYQRNRMWVEAFNETIRDIERFHRVRGAGIAATHLAVLHKIELKNTDEFGIELAPPRIEEMKAASMHNAVSVFLFLVATVPFLACVFT